MRNTPACDATGVGGAARGSGESRGRGGARALGARGCEGGWVGASRRGVRGGGAPAWVQRVGFRDGARREARDARAHHHVLHGLEASRGDEGAAVSLHVARCPSTGACGDASGLSRPGLGDSAKPITPAGVGARRASEVEKAGRRRAATSRTARALPAPPPPQCDRRGAGDGRASHSSRESEPPRATAIATRRGLASEAGSGARATTTSRRAAAGGGVGGPEEGASGKPRCCTSSGRRPTSISRRYTPSGRKVCLGRSAVLGTSTPRARPPRPLPPPPAPAATGTVAPIPLPPSRPRRPLATSPHSPPLSRSPPTLNPPPPTPAPLGAGFSELCRLDGRFDAYAKALFSRSASETNRELQDKEANAKLDASLEGFLRLLSGFFLNPAATKALEYLIRRFKIHVFNVDAAVACALPYHSTPEFVRLVQLCALDGTGFYFLAGVKATGAAPPRDQLVKRCVNDAAFFSFVCEAAATAASNKVSARGTTPNPLPGGRKAKGSRPRRRRFGFRSDPTRSVFFFFFSSARPPARPAPRRPPRARWKPASVHRLFFRPTRLPFVALKRTHAAPGPAARWYIPTRSNERICRRPDAPARNELRKQQWTAAPIGPLSSSILIDS